MSAFYSLQGEGMRTGTPNVFIRFTGCNLQCDLEAGPKSPGGFACDTEFASGRKVTLDELWEWIQISVEIATGMERPKGKAWTGWIILTGGEPMLQVDEELVRFLHDKGCYLAIETNGTIPVHPRIDWVTLSPKVAEHALKVLVADEVKYVRGHGQGIPRTEVSAKHYLISPAFEGGQVHPKTMAWCTRLILENPQWRLSIQTHKMMGVR